MDDITGALASAARSINRSHSLQETLQAIVEAVRLSLPDFDHVGISTTSKGGRVETRAGTGQVVWDLDALQYSLGEGPCVDSLRGRSIVVAPRIRHDQRWPRYVPAAIEEHGLAAQLAVRLYLDDEGTVGGLNIYSTRSEEVREEDVALAELFAAHAAVAFGHAREVETLTEGLAGRKIIGQAIGLLMAEYRITEDAAFAYLRRASSLSNVKLRDVATRIVAEANERAGSPERR